MIQFFWRKKCMYTQTKLLYNNNIYSIFDIVQKHWPQLHCTTTISSFSEVVVVIILVVILPFLNSKQLAE